MKLQPANKEKFMSNEKIGKRQARRQQMERQRLMQRVVVFGMIVVGIALLALAAFWQNRPVSVDDVIKVTPVALPNPNGLSLGDANAKVVIDVFEDFQCPACQYFTEDVETLVIENLVATGKARYVFHNYPFIDGATAGEGGESDQAANASMCANEQGKFWEMHSTIYANWDQENQGAFSNPRLQAMAQNVGLDMDAFTACFKANKYKADIQADLDLGKQMGVSGTPTVFVNGKQVGQLNSIATYEEIAQAVEQALNQ
jgi:protein-disulfide isomerase